MAGDPLINVGPLILCTIKKKTMFIASYRTNHCCVVYLVEATFVAQRPLVWILQSLRSCTRTCGLFWTQLCISDSERWIFVYWWWKIKKTKHEVQVVAPLSLQLTQMNHGSPPEGSLPKYSTLDSDRQWSVSSYKSPLGREYSSHDFILKVQF